MSLQKSITLLLFTIILIGCSNKDSDHSNDGKTVFRYNESAGINTLDPALVRRFEDFLAVNQIFNGLVTLDENMNVVPAIASSWDISNDGKVYTFYLREDVKFHNHAIFRDENERKVTSKDVVYSLLRIIDPTTASPGQYIFKNIDRGVNSEFKGILTEGDYIVKIYLEKPQPSFLYQLSLPYCSVVPSSAISFFGNDFGENPIGTGPFEFKKWKRNVKLVLGKNADYFEKDKEGNSLPYLDAVAITFIKDRHVEFVEFTNGKLEMISGLNEDEKDELIQADGTLNPKLENDFYLQKTPWLNTDYLGILVDDRIPNVKNSPLSQQKVRQAIGYAIDMEAMVKHLRNNIGTPATTGFIPKGMPGYEKYAIEGFKYDLDKAKKLLSEAGYTSNKDIPKITLVATAEYTAMCTYIQKSLEDLGLNVNIDILSPSYMGQSIAQFEATFYRKSWIADYPDAINYFQLFYSKNFYPENGLNYTHFKNNTFDELYELALIEDSTALRYEYYKDMQQIIHDEAPVIPLFYAETLRFLSKKVSGLKGNSLNMLNLKETKIEN